MELVKHWLRRLFGDYGYYRIFTISLPVPPVTLPDGVSVRPLTKEELSASGDSELRARAWFGGPDAQGYGLYEGDRLVALQWYWWGERYRRQRNSWPLGPNDAKSVELYTVPECRGKGYAVLLKAYSAALMAKQGFRRLYSRIWHNNWPSIRVSEKSGWRQIGRYIEIFPFGLKIKIRLPL